MRYAAELGQQDGRKLPPVEKWNPAYCGELDLVIRRDGVWVHEGTPIGRAKLVRLFSTVIRKEGDRYFLVTPAEKLGITVEEAPFTAVLMRTEQGQQGPTIIFTTNVGDEVAAGPSNILTYRETPIGRAPFVRVRGNLDALVSRSVFYDLVRLGETRDIDGEAMFGVASSGAFFPFCKANGLSAEFGDE